MESFDKMCGCTEALILSVCVFACCLYIQAWAVSGEPRDFSGVFQESSPHRWATPAASHPTPLTKRSAQVILSAPRARICTFSHMHAPLHFDIRYLIAFPPWEEVERVGRTFLCEISQGSRDQKKCKGKKKKIQSREGCFKYSALILSPPSPSSAVNYSECTAPDGLHPPSPPPHDLLVRIGLCTVLYCGVFCQQRLLCMKRHKWASLPETAIWRT